MPTIIPDNPNNYAKLKAGNKGYTPTGGAAPSYEDDTTLGDGSYVLGYPDNESGPPFYGKKEVGVDYLDEPEVKRFFSAMFAYADEHRRPREIIWDNCWRLYNNQYDWSTKAWWQHRAPIPKVRASVDRAVALFRKTLLKMNPWYGIQAESKLGRTKGRYTMLLTDYWFDQANIQDEMMQGFKTGLVTSVAALKVWWMRVKDFKPTVYTESKEVPTYEYGLQTGTTLQEEKKARLDPYFKGKLGVMAVNPRNLWVVPGTNGKGIIERSQASLQEIEALADYGVYDKAAVKRLRDQICGPTETALDTSRQTVEGLAQANQYLRLVDLYHYWGDIYTPQGVLVKCDATFTLANKDIMIRAPHDNPFYHKDHPYIIGTPYSIPFSTYNRGMVEDVAEIAEAITEMANLIADGALYDAMKAFAIDIDQLDDPNEARQGVYPGKTFLRKSGSAAAPNEQLVQTVDVGKVPAEAMNMIQLFEKYMQEGSYVNEWVSGQGNQQGRTLGEVNIKTAAALEGLDESARNLEITVIEPTLDKVARTIYQFQENYTLPRLVENYPDLSAILQGLTPAERYSTMVGDYNFKVRGMSIMIDRQQKIGELKEILQLLSYLPGFIEQLNPIATLEEVLMPLGWDPARLLMNPGAMGVSMPTVGALPPPPQMPMLPPPMGGPQGGGLVGPGGPGRTPMATRAAEDGAKYGGARDNPVARGGNPAASQGLGGAPGGALPPQLMQLVQQLMQRQRQRM